MTGHGFFTDAYDLFIIGVVIKLLSAQRQLGALDDSILGAIALVSAATRR